MHDREKAAACESMRSAALAGCTQIEHGIFATDEVLKLLSDRGTYFDPQCSLVFRNYLDNKPKFLGIGNYTEAGFAAMENALPLAVDTAFRVSIALTLGALFIAGALKTTMTARPWLRSGLETALIGALAAGATFVAGRLIAQ